MYTEYEDVGNPEVIKREEIRHHPEFIRKFVEAAQEADKGLTTHAYLAGLGFDETEIANLLTRSGTY